MENYYGNLIIIGGAEDKEKRCEILNSVIDRTKTQKGPLLVFSTASSIPSEVNEAYTKIFSGLGFNDFKTIDIRDRKDAQDSYLVKELEMCGGVFFTGGDQLRITSIIGGSLLHNSLINEYKKGKLIAGTSAGASCLCSTMLVTGIEEASPQKCTIKMAPGLGFINDVIIDQHFSQRGRIGRLLNAVAQNPHVLGIGIDEDTAIVLEGKSEFSVIGKGAVSIVEGRYIRYTNVSELYPDEVLAIENAILHVVPAGYSFDLEERKLTGKRNIEEDKK